MLKNILSLLLSKFYSKQESEAVGHQAMPSPSNTVITPSIKTECTTWSDAHIGIAPADGYLYVTGRTTNTDGFLQISSDTTEIAATTFGNTDKDIRLLFPFAKGQAMKVTAKSLKNIFLRFSSSIGGGYQALKNALLQGGVLCRLKHLCNSLRRSSCRVKDRGFNTQLVRPRMQRPSALQPMVIGTRLHPAGTVMSHTLETPQALFWKSLTAAQVSLILNRSRDGTLFLYRKVKNLVISFQQIQQCPICTLSLCGVQTNSAVGGPLC